MKDAVSPAELEGLLNQGADIKVLDVRRREHRAAIFATLPFIVFPMALEAFADTL